MQGGKYFDVRSGDVIDTFTEEGNVRFNRLSTRGIPPVRISDAVAERIEKGYAAAAKPKRKRASRKKKSS